MSTAVPPSQLMKTPSPKILECDLYLAPVLILVNAANRTLHDMDSTKINNKTIFDT
jgi:hypothetical protein